MAKGSDGRGHAPALVAGQIYKSLRHRFGSNPGSMPYASIPVPTRPKLDANAAAALSDEDKEDAMGDEETNDAASGDIRTGGNGVKSTIMTVPQSRAPEANVRPSSPNNTGTTDQDRQRPRRVHSSNP